MPSSLAMLLPPALGSSPHPPVSVCGTGARQAIAAFLGTCPACFATPFRSASRHRPCGGRLFRPPASSACTGFSLPGPCFAHASLQFCSRAVQESPPVVLRLRVPASPSAPTCPGQISFTLETLDIRPRGFPPLSRYSFRHSLFLPLHCALRHSFSARRIAPLPAMFTWPPGFGGVFQPRTFSAQDLSTSELLRTL